jgi:hypothetical protein
MATWRAICQIRSDEEQDFRWSDEYPLTTSLLAMRSSLRLKIMVLSQVEEQAANNPIRQRSGTSSRQSAASRSWSVSAMTRPRGRRCGFRCMNAAETQLFAASPRLSARGSVRQIGEIANPEILIDVLELVGKAAREILLVVDADEALGRAWHRSARAGRWGLDRRRNDSSRAP